MSQKDRRHHSHLAHHTVPYTDRTSRQHHRMARRQDQAFAVCRACRRRHDRWVTWQPTPESGRAAPTTGAQLRTPQARECRSFSRTSNSATAASTWAGASYHSSTTQQPVRSHTQRSTHPPPRWLCLLHNTICLPLYRVLSIRRLFRFSVFCLLLVLSHFGTDGITSRRSARAGHGRCARGSWCAGRGSQYNLTWAQRREHANRSNREKADKIQRSEAMRCADAPNRQIVVGYDDMTA